MNFKLEICCASADDVFAAAEGGAHRVELNSALFLGGLTPSIGLVRKAKEADIPIMVMVRPRDGGFCYTEREFECMLEDVKAFVKEGVEGLVFGVLHPDGSIDITRNRQLIEAAGKCEKVFHRAFDVVPDWREAMDTLIELGFDRVLTSGQAATSIEGAQTLKEMIEYADGRIEILPGGGIRPHNVSQLIEKTGCTQIHASAGKEHTDTSCRSNPEVHFGSSTDMPEDIYKITDVEKVRAILAEINSLMIQMIDFPITIL